MAEKSKDVIELERLLYELDITNPEASRACGVTVQTVYRWLRGDAPIPKMALRLFQLMLNIKGTENMIRVQWCEPPKGETDDVAA